jgi:hypothetical protein
MPGSYSPYVRGLTWKNCTMTTLSPAFCSMFSHCSVLAIRWTLLAAAAGLAAAVLLLLGGILYDLEVRAVFLAASTLLGTGFFGRTAQGDPVPDGMRAMMARTSDCKPRLTAGHGCQCAPG